MTPTKDHKPGFTEDETKDVELSSGGGLSQSDPDHSLRGEDQLVDGVVDEEQLAVPGGLEEEEEE